MADVAIVDQKRITLATGVKQRLVFSPATDNLILKKVGAGNIAYMVNAVEGDMADIDEVKANTLDDTFPTRDLYKRNKIKYLVVLSDADVVLEIDTDKSNKVVA